MPRVARAYGLDDDDVRTVAGRHGASRPALDPSPPMRSASRRSRLTAPRRPRRRASRRSILMACCWLRSTELRAAGSRLTSWPSSSGGRVRGSTSACSHTGARDGRSVCGVVAGQPGEAVGDTDRRAPTRRSASHRQVVPAAPRETRECRAPPAGRGPGSHRDRSGDHAEALPA